jgi:hypothetical protein
VVCRLQLLLVLAKAVILKSECRTTHDHILLSQIRDSLNLEGQVPVEAGANTSTVALRVVGATKMERSGWGYN